MNLYSIYDAVALVWLPPVMQRTDGEAARGFSAAVSDPQHDFFKQSIDLRLYKVGSFDQDTGEIKPITPELILSGGEAAARVQRERLQAVGA